MRSIDDPKESIMLYQQMATSVNSEALLLLPSSLQLVRAKELGIIDKLIQGCEKRGAEVRILCPHDESNSQLVGSIQNGPKRVTILPYQKYSFSSILLIVNSNEFIQVELRNPASEESESGLGFAVHSNSKPSVETFKTFFDVLWNQTSLNEEF